jgi:hypothetical protein
MFSKERAEVHEAAQSVKPLVGLVLVALVFSGLALVIALAASHA